ncbi:unnamed protein product [Amoebophrya sp. A25]|nr:unnamed protein product [Amoebophrya sp. A25]|eukprot:GSA25T00002744001.1
MRVGQEIATDCPRKNALYHYLLFSFLEEEDITPYCIHVLTTSSSSSFEEDFRHTFFPYHAHVPATNYSRLLLFTTSCKPISFPSSPSNTTSHSCNITCLSCQFLTPTYEFQPCP